MTMMWTHSFMVNRPSDVLLMLVSLSPSPSTTDPDQLVGLRQHQRRVHPSGSRRGCAGGQGQEGRRHRLRGLRRRVELGKRYFAVRMKARAWGGGVPLCCVVFVASAHAPCGGPAIGRGRQAVVVFAFYVCDNRAWMYLA